LNTARHFLLLTFGQQRALSAEHEIHGSNDAETSPEEIKPERLAHTSRTVTFLG
jgi:hypothetical protein